MRITFMISSAPKMSIYSEQGLLKNLTEIRWQFPRLKEISSVFSGLKKGYSQLVENLVGFCFQCPPAGQNPGASGVCGLWCFDTDPHQQGHSPCHRYQKGLRQLHLCSQQTPRGVREKAENHTVPPGSHRQLTFREQDNRISPWEAPGATGNNRILG